MFLGLMKTVIVNVHVNCRKEVVKCPTAEDEVA